MYYVCMYVSSTTCGHMWILILFSRQFFIARDDNLLATELAAKLEPAFMFGLKCIQPQIRSRFMEVNLFMS